jgi:hypothetical protein
MKLDLMSDIGSLNGGCFVEVHFISSFFINQSINQSIIQSINQNQCDTNQSNLNHLIARIERFAFYCAAEWMYDG